MPSGPLPSFVAEGVLAATLESILYPGNSEHFFWNRLQSCGVCAPSIKVPVRLCGRYAEKSIAQNIFFGLTFSRRCTSTTGPDLRRSPATPSDPCRRCLALYELSS